jgi:hypothetical protein
MPPNTPNYMDDPNQDIYQMLAQRNMSRSSSGGGGGGNEIDIMSARAALDELAEGRADSRGLRNRALDAMARRAERRADIEAQGATMDLNKQFMEDIAKRKMDLLIQENQLNLEMARAEMEGDPEMVARKSALEKQRADINARELAANAEMSKRNAEHGKAFSQRVGELNMYRTSLDEWNVKHKGSLNADGTIMSLLNDPTRYGGVANAERFGADTIVENIGEGLIEKFYSGDKVKDLEIARKMGIADAGAMPGRMAGLIAAAARYGGKDSNLLSYMDQSAAPDSFRESQAQRQLRLYSGETYQRDADAFSNDLLGDIVVKGLSNSGMDLNQDGARMAVNKVMGILNDATRSTSTNPNEVSKAVMDALEPAAIAIFGPNEGTKAVPKLVQAIQTSLSEAQTLANKYGSEVMGAGGVVGFDNIQKAAVAHALKRSGSLGMALKAAVNGKVFTADQVALALGEVGGLSDAATGKLDYGLLNLDATTEQGKMIRDILGGKQVEDLQAMLGARKTRTKGEEASKADLLKIEQEFSRDIPAAEMKRKMTVNERKQAILAEKLKRLR